MKKLRDILQGTTAQSKHDCSLHPDHIIKTGFSAADAKMLSSVYIECFMNLNCGEGKAVLKKLLSE